jgi:signal transduction histidine kinase
MTPQPASGRGDYAISWRVVLRGLPIVAGLGTTIALLVVVITPGESFLKTLLVSNIIGLCAWSVAVLVRHLSAGRVSVPAAAVLGAVPAMLAGLSMVGFLSGHQPLWWLQDPWHNWRTLATTALLTVAAVAFAVRSYAASDYRARLEAQGRQAAEARQGEALARLGLLQAQIEPHFLFNTLANVQSMIERDPRTAARMLDHLNRYLRASLGRTRAPSSTCAEEMELIGALLAIAEIRLGGRLRYRIELPQELRQARLPPLLLQPLVENALKHGIEPAVGGGEVEVLCAARGGHLVLTVRDTGLGFREEAPAGVGLSNVRARLSSLYGDEGCLTLYHNEPSGTVAEITVPLQPAAQE